MILRTITDESTGAIKSIGLFGKSLNEIKGILNSFKQNGVISTLLNTPLINIDTQAIDNYNNAIRSGMGAEQALAIARKTTNAETVALIESSNGLVVQTERVTAAQRASTLSAKAATAATKALAIAGNMITFTLISKGIELVVNGFDNWIHRVENANKAMDNAVSEYESAKSSLESVNSELENQNQLLYALLSKDKLTYTEKGELEELQKITKELMIQQEIEENRAEKASKNAAAKTVDAYEKQYGKYSITKSDVESALDSEIFPHSNSADDVTSNIAAYIRYAELLDEARSKYNDAVEKGENPASHMTDIQYYVDMMEEASAVLEDNLSDLNEKRLALNDQYHKAIEKQEEGSSPLTTSEKNIISSYEEISDAIRLIYEYTNPDSWNAQQISGIFSAEDIEKTKEELIEMAKSGTLDEETIQSCSKLNSALEDSNLLLNDGQSAANALYDEIYALAEEEEKAENAISMDSIPFLEAFTSPDFSEARQSLSDLSSAGELTPETLSSVGEYKTLLEHTAMSAEELVNAINHFNLDELSSNYNDVLNILDRIQNGKKLTSEEAASLIANHSELADQLIITSDGCSFEENALISLANSYAKTANLVASNQAEQTRITMEEIKNRVKAYGIEGNALAEIARIYSMTKSDASVSDYLHKNYGVQISHYIPALVSAAQEYSEAESTLDNLLSQLYQPIEIDEKDSLSRITDKYSRLNEVIESGANLINSQISLLETMGSTVGRAYYEELVSRSEQKLSLLTRQHEELRQELANTDKTSDKWQELSSSIFEVQNSIIQTKTELEDLQNTIDDLHWSSFDKVTEAINGISVEADDLVELLKCDTLLDENNRLTDKALTQLALYGEQMEAAKYLVNKFSAEIEYLNGEYANGTITSEKYTEKLKELTQGQWDSAEAYNSAKKAIIDLRKNAVEEELNALEELYDLRKKVWELEKEQYDWEKTKAENESSITGLKQQIEELSNDDSLAGIKKRKELEAELEKAQADWTEELYEHSLKERNAALDEELEVRKSELEATLNDEEALLSETLDMVNSNSERVLKTLNDLSRQYGININTALTEPFTHGSQALSNYSSLFTQTMSAFTAQLDNTCLGIYALQTQADLAAVSMINMFNSANGTLLEQITIVENALQDFRNELVNIRNEADETANTLYNTISGSSYLKLPTINSTLASLVHNGSNTSLPLFGTPINAPDTLTGYASGTRSAAGGFHPTFEEGTEIIESDGHLLVNYKGGETVFSNEQVGNLWELSKKNWIPNLPNYDTLMSRAVNRDELRNVNFDQNIASLITVEGDMTPDVLKQLTLDKGIVEKIKNIALEGAVEAIYTRGFRK